jgi:uncharacterized membrane protein YphA (DoxX/SURF4 family)
MRLSFEITTRSLLRWLIAIVLIWAALGKLANLQEFYGTLTAYRLPLPAVSLRLAAIVLPWLELVCALLLATGLWRKAALSWAVALFAIFALGTLQAWWRGLAINCGCLDLRVIGVSPGSAAASWLESVPFAFFRAAALWGAALFLLRSKVMR